MLAMVILSEGGIYPDPPKTYLGTMEMEAAVITVVLMNFLRVIMLFDLRIGNFDFIDSSSSFPIW